MVKQDKLDAESDNQIEELKVAAQVRARELDRELKMKKANATLEAEEKDRVAKRKVEEANIAAAKGDEDAYIIQAMQEIKGELNSTNLKVKSMAVLKLAYLNMLG